MSFSSCASSNGRLKSASVIVFSKFMQSASLNATFASYAPVTYCAVTSFTNVSVRF
ncbi:hypothetical protein D3C83_171150 [compost metagenome]